MYMRTKSLSKRLKALSNTEIRVSLWLFLFVFLLFVCYFIGFYNGANTTARYIFDMGMDLLDIKLSPAAYNLLLSNPKILDHAIELNSEDIDNPFSSHPQASLHYELCMIELKNETKCYTAQINKYGNVSLPIPLSTPITINIIIK